MSCTSSRVNVGNASQTRLDVTTETDVASQTTAANAALRFGQHFMARNRHATLSLFVGDQNVTTATGFEVLPGETFVADLQKGDAVYGITSAAGPVPVHVFQAGV